ncbi:precorrin-4 C(11)-methyltransferase [Prochlorococcus marinus]|uniref:Precorrin-4 C11-methyltransferase n=1 Tax=Prochlorococcus marinus (strain MIT 9211) TaxID=93059 RepID=A9BE81_PROM4|nr:precorrin-4 C(11)-methyltransferase [Prochlorococcus marinus]ABX08391.1 precorrin-4 C11-methyltransferase [Prochlorococcus marinus str. MIT 9211]
MNLLSIVGAGPGAPDLLTVRALDRIQKAEILIWTDSLISPQIAALAPKNCQKIKTSSLTLEEIIPLLIKETKKGKKVVRLHDGDPNLFGAISEQICSLAEAGIEVEVIPGISAYQATACALQKELTIPGVVQTIVLSRTEGRTAIPENEKLENLASLKATLCLYLSARHVDKVQATLLKYYSDDTPVAIGYRVSWQDEWLTIVPLRKMASVSKKKGLFRTTLYIISPALNPNKRRSRLYSPDHKHLFRQT